jgi:hypothetical protein
MYQAPSYVWAAILLATIGIPLLAVVALYRGALAARMPRRTATGVAVVAASLLGGWFVVTSLLASSGTYARTIAPAVELPVLTVAAVGTLAALLLATTIPVVSRSLSAPGSLARLALAQTPRVEGFVFLIVLAQGALPAGFAWPAAVGDMATGLAAPFVARQLTRGSGRRLAVWFNVFGLVDLINAVTLGVLFGLGVFAVEPAPQALAFLPLALVPTLAVPVAITLHVVSLRRLLAGARGKDQDTSMTIPTGEPTTMHPA